VTRRTKANIAAAGETSALVREYVSGLSLHAVGEKFGMSGANVVVRLKAAGVQRRPRGPIAKCEKNERAEAVA
jgi:hypothetical protein